MNCEVEFCVFAAILAAVIMHVGWNIIVKSSIDRFASVSLITMSSSIAAPIFVSFVRVPKSKI